MISLIKSRELSPHGYATPIFHHIALYFCIASLALAEEVKTEDQLNARLSYAQAAFFDVSYYKDRYELESRHHGDIEPDNPIMIRALHQLDQGIINFQMMLENIKSDKIFLTDETRVRILEDKIASATGSRLIAIFEYTKVVSNNDYEQLKKYFIQLATKYENSKEPLYNSIYDSWNKNKISIPANDENGKLTWKMLTPLEYMGK